MSTPFEPGERVLFLDARGRRYLVRLQAKGTFHTHGGAVPHDLVLGRDEGVEVRTSGGMVLRAFRPRMADYVLKMPRGAQVVYPKDLGPILVYADIFPGAEVVEAGTGSGALTIALARATGPEGRVVSYELRDEFRERAASNIESFFGKMPPRIELRGADLRDVAESGETFHRAVLDLPNPWDMLDALGSCARRGGDPVRVSADDRPGPAARPRPRGRRIPPRRHDRDPPAKLARDGSQRPAGPPDGGPYGLPEHRPPDVLIHPTEPGPRAYGQPGPCRRRMKKGEGRATRTSPTRLCKRAEIDSIHRGR